jgi:alkylation response protein AidB-like acyl-CoA dehydrogenase
MFDVKPEEEALLDEFARFAEKELRPLSDRYAEGPVLETAVAKDVFAQLAKFGLIGGMLPEESGGDGLGLVAYGNMFEKLASVWPDLAVATIIQAVTLSLIDDVGTTEQKERYLAPMLDGSLIGCMCISEPEVGSNVSDVRTSARRDGDQFVVNGQKLWISNGEWSDFAIVVCRTEEELSLVLVDRADGYTSRNIEKMGLHAASTAELFFDDVRVPQTNILGKPGTGLRSTLRLFERARALVGLTSVGIARAALDEAVSYAKQRVQHGKPIAGHQLIQGYIAEMATEIDAARLLCQRALALLQQGARCDTESSMAKWFATEMAVGVASKALQIHGGFGITKEYRVERLFRDARIMPIPDGTTEIQKLIIARNILGVSAFS